MTNYSRFELKVAESEIFGSFHHRYRERTRETLVFPLTNLPVKCFLVFF